MLIFQVWMYEYFGVGAQVWEDVDGIYPRFLCWLPKYRLPTPSKRSLEVCYMVINNLTISDVSFFFFFFWWDFVFKGFCDLIVVWSSFHSGFFVIFKYLWILGLEVRSMLSVNRL